MHKMAKGSLDAWWRDACPGTARTAFGMLAKPGTRATRMRAALWRLPPGDAFVELGGGLTALTE